MVCGFKKNNIIAFLILIGLTVGFYAFHPGMIKASPGTIEFTDDVLLDLSGLDIDAYIAAGSRAEGVAISGADLTVSGVPVDNNFLLKTETNRKLLLFSPIGGTAGFVFSSSHVSGGYVTQWTESGTVAVSRTLSVPQSNTYYIVSVNGSEIGESPFHSGENAEIAFSRVGTGTEVFSVNIDTRCKEHDMSGWAWSDGVGWVSFSCETDAGLGTVLDYGVDLEEVVEGEYNLVGYAWSDTVGWIYFDPDGAYPGSPEHSAKYFNDTRKIIGWAKVLSSDEWIKLGPIVIDDVDYGAYVSGSEVHNWAWGDLTVGWLSFNCANENECGVSDYKVIIGISDDPQIVSPDHELLYCARTLGYGQRAAKWEDNGTFNDELAVRFGWEYQHPHDLPQSSFNFQLSTDGGGEFESGVIFDKEVSSYANNGEQVNYTPNLLGENVELSWSSTYYWRVKVYDNEEGESDWSPIRSFTLDNNPHPYAHFEDPSPSLDEQVYFDGTESRIYREGGTISYFWTFTDGVPASSIEESEWVEFGETGGKTVTLEVSDGVNSCTKSMSVRVRYPLPDWREVTPFGKAVRFLAALPQKFIGFAMP